MERGAASRAREPEHSNPTAPTAEETGQRTAFEARGRWWLVHTRPRNEKALGMDLRQMSIAYFLPLVRAQRRGSGQTWTVHLPLFPGYLFLRGDDEHRYAALATKRAVNVIQVGDQELLHQELASLARVFEADAEVDLYPRITKGQRCRIVHGPLKGIEGTVLRRHKVCAVYLSVTLLGQSAEVEIDPSLLEAIE